MKHIKTEEFLYFPRKAVSLVGMEIAIGEMIRVERAGRYYFHEPYFGWGKVKEDHLTVVPFDEWALARLGFLFSLDPTQLTEFELHFLCFPLEVCDQSGETMASLTLRGTQYSSRWDGFATAYAIGREAVASLEARLVTEPFSLMEYKLVVPGRGTIGWNGQRFHTQKTVRRKKEDFLVREFEFCVTESPFKIDSAGAKRKRFTDSWPPPEMLKTIPNWIFALDEKGRPGQDETTLKPASNQRTIDHEITYTAGEAWLPDGRILPCMIGLEQGVAMTVVCFDAEKTWEVPCLPDGCNPVVTLSEEQASQFPLRVVSQLSQSKRDDSKTIRFMITNEGKTLPWRF